MNLSIRQMHHKILAPCYLRSPPNVPTFGLTQADNHQPAILGTKIISFALHHSFRGILNSITFKTYAKISILTPELP